MDQTGLNNRIKKEWAEVIEGYRCYLIQEERSSSTVSKYLHDLNQFFKCLSDAPLSKEQVLRWKAALIEVYAPSSVNSMLAAVNNFLKWYGKPQYRVKPLKLQQLLFIAPEKELTRLEYIRLVQTAQKEKKERLALLLQAICATGIRISELKNITVEAVKEGRATVSCKGKTRVIFLCRDLCHKLKRYSKVNSILSGPIFVTKSGKIMDRSNIWKEMKLLCSSAGVSSEKVFPHNLRHLFARCYYQVEHDLGKLADLLGHSNLSTTRIYTMESGIVHEKQISRMKLVLDGI